MVLSGTLETEKAPSFLITEDFNKDGKLDLVVTNSVSHSFSYFKGHGDGTFKDQIIFKTGQDPICITAGDFNRDGYLDLAVVNYADQTVQIFINTRYGTFKRAKTLLKPGKIPINVTAGDFNEDGAADLAVTMRYHKVVLFLGKGNGRFFAPQTIAVKGQPTGVITSDYNKDKHLDVAVALAGSGYTGVQILWGKGDGTLSPSKRFKGGGLSLVTM